MSSSSHSISIWSLNVNWNRNSGLSPDPSSGNSIWVAGNPIRVGETQWKLRSRVRDQCILPWHAPSLSLSLVGVRVRSWLWAWVCPDFKFEDELHFDSVHRPDEPPPLFHHFTHFTHFSPFTHFTPFYPFYTILPIISPFYPFYPFYPFFTILPIFTILPMSPVHPPFFHYFPPFSPFSTIFTIF